MAEEDNNDESEIDKQLSAMKTKVNEEEAEIKNDNKKIEQKHEDLNAK